MLFSGLNEVDGAIEKLRAESDELDVALRVFRRFSAGSMSEDEAANKLGPPRPNGIPTLFNMTYEVIRDAEQRGQNGLSGKEIVEAIEKQYWPGLQPQQVLPSVYGFAKKGRLKKSEDGQFHTVRTKEAPTDNSEGASKPENGGTSNTDMFS